MASFKQQDLQGVSTGHLRPVAEDSSTMAADLLKIAGNEGVALFKEGVKSSFEDDVEQLKNDYMGEEPWYSAEEVQAVKSFKDRVALFQKGAAQAGRQGEFKTRAEALLKEQSTSFPGLADEFRGIAAKGFQFDPTGHSLKERMARETSQAADHKKQLQLIEAEAKSYGMGVGDIYRKGGPEKFQTYAAVHRRINDLKLAKQLAEGEKSLQGVVDVSRQLMTSTPQIRDANYQTAWGTVRSVLETVEGYSVDEKTGKGLMPTTNVDLLSKMNPEAKAQAIATLKKQKDDYINQMMQFRADFKNGEQWNDWQDQATKPFDEALAALSSEEALKSFRQGEELRGASYASGIANTEAYEVVLGLKAVGFKADSLINGNLGVDTIEAITNKFKGTKVFYDPNASGSNLPDNTPELGKGIKALSKDVLETFKSGLSDDNEIDSAMGSYVALLLHSDEQGYNVDVVDDVINTITSPEAAEYFKAKMAENPAFSEHMEDSIRTHVDKIVTKVGQRLKKSETRYNVTDKGIPEFDLIYKDGKYTLQSNQAWLDARAAHGAKGYDIKTGKTVTFKSAPINNRRKNELIKTWLTPLNNATKAMSELYGIDPDQVARDTLTGTPYEKFLPSEEGAETTPKSKKNSSPNIVPETAQTMSAGKYRLKSGQVVMVNEDGTWEVVK